MLTRDQRATKAAMWLAHWQGCEALGVSMAEYARREGFDIDAAYRWKRILSREGHMAVSNAPKLRRKKPSVVAKFARVAVHDAPPAMLLLRLVLTNGRRAELQIGAVNDLSEVLSVLERGA